MGRPRVLSAGVIFAYDDRTKLFAGGGPHSPQNPNGDDIVVNGHRVSQSINIPTPPVILPYGPLSPGDKPGTFYGPKQPKGPRSTLRYVPPEGQGGPPGSKGYWKIWGPDQSFDGRYDLRGNPISPDQAHPNPLPSSSIFFRGGVVGIVLCALFCADPAW